MREENKVVNFLDRKSLAEIYSKGLEYSFLDKNFRGVHVPVRCKDFLTDVIWAETTGNTATIYGFSHAPGNYREFKEKDRLLLGLREELAPNTPYRDHKDIIVRLSDLLWQFEDKLGFSRSELHPDKNGSFSVEFDKKWTDKPYMLSLLTLLIRVGRDYNVNKESVEEFINRASNFGTNDGMYLRQASKAILEIFNNPTKLLEQTYSQYGTIHSIHGSSGIVSLSAKIKK